jgi:hypothetical protein
MSCSCCEAATSDPGSGLAATPSQIPGGAFFLGAWVPFGCLPVGAAPLTLRQTCVLPVNGWYELSEYRMCRRSMLLGLRAVTGRGL